MENINIQYKELLREILDEGFEYTDKSRNVQRKQIAHKTLEIDLQQGFPAINLKKLYWKGVVGELIWFLKGDTNIKYLVDNGINIWNKDAYNYYLKIINKNKGWYKNEKLFFEEFVTAVKTDRFKKMWWRNKPYVTTGDCGNIYGKQWRNFESVDQISNLIKGLKENPMGTRHLVTAWNPSELDNMVLPPCHWSFEILVEPIKIGSRAKYINSEDFEKKLRIHLDNYDKEPKHLQSAIGFREDYCDKNNIPKYGFTLKWHQRSCDFFLGVPFNIASYALLAHIIGKLTNMVPKTLIGDLSNVHLYENSWKASRELIKRDPTKFKLPKLGIMDHLDSFVSENVNNFINALRIQDFKLLDYESYDNIKVDMLSPNT